MSPDLAAALISVGKVLLASLYVVGGVRHLFILPVLTEAIRARGVPAPRLVLLAATVVEIAAGVALVAGWNPALAAAALIGFTLAASVLMLNFWDQTGETRSNSISAWQANIALIGGLLIAAAA